MGNWCSFLISPADVQPETQSKASVAVSPATNGGAEETVNVLKLLAACLVSAEKAGDVIRQVWKSGDLQITDKGGDDPLTQADIKSQQLIEGALRKIWPNIAVVGEEECEPVIPNEAPSTSGLDQYLDKLPEKFRNVPLSDVCVFIDPLDATKEFTLGNVERVICLVGVAVKGEAVAGVMYQPFVDSHKGDGGTTLWGIVGLGAFGVEKVERTEETKGMLVLATSGSKSSTLLDNAVSALSMDHVMRVGGSGFKALLVINGSADAYMFPSKGTKLWDTAAPEAVLRALGGKFSDAQGNPILYTKDADVQNRRGVLASATPELHERFTKALAPLHDDIEAASS